MSSSWDSSPPPPPTSNQGMKAFRGKARRARKVVLVQPEVSSSSSPSQVVSKFASRHRLVPVEEGLQEAQDQRGDAQVNAVSRLKGQPSQEGSANGHYGREEQKEEPKPQVMSHSCLPQSSSVNCLPLIPSTPMFGSSPVAGRMTKFNPWAPEFWPRTPGASCWVPAGQLSSQLPAVWASSTWLGGDNFLGIGPWPMAGPGPMTPTFGPSFGSATSLMWLPGQ